MMSDFRQKSAGILCVFQGFLTTKTALVVCYDECRDVFRGCLIIKNAAASDRRQKPYLSVDLKTAGFSTLHKQVAELQRACSLHYS